MHRSCQCRRHGTARVQSFLEGGLRDRSCRAAATRSRRTRCRARRILLDPQVEQKQAAGECSVRTTVGLASRRSSCGAQQAQRLSQLPPSASLDFVRFLHRNDMPRRYQSSKHAALFFVYHCAGRLEFTAGLLRGNACPSIVRTRWRSSRNHGCTTPWIGKLCKCLCSADGVVSDRSHWRDCSMPAQPAMSGCAPRITS